VRAEIGYVLRFLAVGVLNTCVGLGTIYACKYFFSLGDVAANLIGYAVGLTNSFLWNRRWTFSHSGDTTGTIIRFMATFVVAYAANLVAVLLLTRGVGVNSYLAHALATAPYTVIFYLGSRHYVFARRSS
jgi:putative flippase GtrA